MRQTTLVASPHRKESSCLTEQKANRGAITIKTFHAHSTQQQQPHSMQYLSWSAVVSTCSTLAACCTHMLIRINTQGNFPHAYHCFPISVSASPDPEQEPEAAADRFDTCSHMHTPTKKNRKHSSVSALFLLAFRRLELPLAIFVFIQENLSFSFHLFALWVDFSFLSHLSFTQAHLEKRCRYTYWYS